MVNMSQNEDPLFLNLNREQSEAVAADLKRHILVLAGAGCGKTTVLTRRIAFLIRSGITAQSILALTFTRKAAEEMSARVMKNDKYVSCQKTPLITTFHGFALKVLSEIINGEKNFERIGFMGNARLISENERLRMLVSLSSKDDRRALGMDLLTLDSLMARFEVFPEKVDCRESDKLNYVKNISELLLHKKQLEGLWDFSDLLTGCLKLFNRCPEIESIYKNRFTAILVDEFQDTNPVQIQLLKKLLSDTTKVFAVGDDDQAIYGFRGADIRPTVEFEKYFTGAQIIKLQTNYRSTPAILTCANEIFSEKNSLYRKVLISGKYSGIKGEKPLLYRFEDQEQMVNWITDKAKTINASRHIPMSKMALLFRTNQSKDWALAFANETNAAVKDSTLLTIHKSKGLEFPVVFLCDLEESVFPNYRLPKRQQIKNIKDFVQTIFKKAVHIDCDWDEEKRLFYVGVTRAEQILFLLSVKKKKIYGRMREFEKSRFCKYV